MINVVCASDLGFIAHMATMLRSLVENNSREEIHIIILLDDQLNDDLKFKINAMLDNYPVSIAFISIKENFPHNLPKSRAHVSRVTYARLLIDRLLPTDIGRILYLDCDMIVRGDIKELWERDLTGKTVGAVREAVPYSNHATLGLPLGAPYFNAGVMLIDLERWRALEIGHRALDFVCNNPDKLLWWDQCALNLVLYEDWMSLENKWNVQTMAVGKGINNSIHFMRMNAHARKAVNIAIFLEHPNRGIILMIIR